MKFENKGAPIITLP